ncbi:MAG: COX15/CtaA family protein [Acidobacteria bacterium]|nr:COX15/CtaA family protein [Acidobacteriota bacterium]
MNATPRPGLARFAWFVLAYNVIVILWGAYVRATGSGAGCGAHWPLCNGEVVPRAPSAEMLVEFSHRVSSGLALVAVIVLVVWVWRQVAAGHPARRGAAASLVFIITEALLGAGLVLFRLVAHDESLARAMVMPLHLANTLILLLCLTLTAHWLSGGAPLRLKGRARVFGILVALLVLFIGVGKSGAVAALGDTLYPSRSLLDGIQADVSSTASLLLRLRILHPALGVVLAAALVFGLAAIPIAADDRRGRMARRAVGVLAAAQVVLGVMNVWLLAPVWMQLLHLLVADLLWIALVLTASGALAEPAVAGPDLDRR